MEISSQQTQDEDQVLREHLHQSSEGDHEIVALGHKYNQGGASRKIGKVIESAPQQGDIGNIPADRSNDRGSGDISTDGEERMSKDLTGASAGRTEESKPKDESLSTDKTRETTDGTSPDTLVLEARSKSAAAEHRTAALREDSVAIGPLREPSTIKSAEAPASHGMRIWEKIVLYDIEAVDLPDTTSVLLGGTLDPYVRAQFSGDQAQTAPLKNIHGACAWVGEALELRRSRSCASSGGLTLEVWDTNPLKDELVGSTNIPFHELTIHTDGGRVKEADAAGARVSPGGVMKTRLKMQLRLPHKNHQGGVLFNVQFKAANFPSARTDRLPTGTSTVTRTTDLLLRNGNSDVTVQKKINETAAVATQVREEHLLEEAVNDGTVVRTAGTLICTNIEASDLPEAEPDGGLLGCSRRDSYVKMYLATAGTREQESKTRVRKGLHRSARWDGEIISFIYGDPSPSVEGIVAEVWNENPGSDIIVGTAVLSVRHVRALALLGGQSAQIRLPLSRKREKGRQEMHGVLTARARLIRDNTSPQKQYSAGESVERDLVRRVQICNASHNGSTGSELEIRPLTATGARLLVFSRLTIHDLPQTEGLMLGGQQDPYVVLTLGAIMERSTTVPGGKLCEWVDETLPLSVESSDTGREGHDLRIEVWNDNHPRRDTLIGSGLVRMEFLREVQRRPGLTVSCRVKLSREGRGSKGTLSMGATFKQDQPIAALRKQSLKPQPEATPLYVARNDVARTLTISGIVAQDLTNTVALGFGGLDTQEPYVVARVGCTERITPCTSIVRGAARWEDSCLTLPMTKDESTLLRLELWNANPIQDDIVGYTEVDTLTVLNRATNDSNAQACAGDAGPTKLEMTLETFNLGMSDENHEGLSPGVLSCVMEVQSQNSGDRESVVLPTESKEGQHRERKYQEARICLPVIRETESPGLLKITVLDAILQQAEAPEVRVTLLPGKRFTSTRPLVAVGGDSQIEASLNGLLRCEWKEVLELPCYALSEEHGKLAILHAEVIVAGVLAGRRVLGRGQTDITEAMLSRTTQTLELELSSGGRGKNPYSVGKVSLSILFVDAWQSSGNDKPPISNEVVLAKPHLPCLHSPGVLRVFVVDAKELSGLKNHQDPYVMVERLAVDPITPNQAKPFCSGVAVVTAGREARWLESCDLRVSSAEAECLRGKPDGGSLRFRVTLMDKELLGGEHTICSLEAIVTPESLSNRESSVLWHRFFSQGRDRGFVRLGCCWIPSEREAVTVCRLRPEERVETGMLYLWLKEGCNLQSVTSNGQRAHGIPMCELELRPYIKLGRKKARDIQGCARVSEGGHGNLDRGVFEKFIKMDFSNINPAEDANLADTPPTFLATVYDRPQGKKVVAGKAEVLLSSLCGYQNVSGEAVSRRLPPTPDPIVVAADSASNNSVEKSQPIFRTSNNIRGTALQPPDDVIDRCPVAAVDKVIPLMDDGMRHGEGSFSDGGARNCATRGGELRLRALYVPNKLANAPGVHSAIKALSRAAESALQRFTENPHGGSLSGRGDVDDDMGESRVLDTDSTALPGALEVFLIRATNLQLGNAAKDPFVQLRLLCSAGCELHTSEVSWDYGGSSCEWNRQFSLLVDDANVEALEVLIIDGHDPLGHRKPLARCNIPLRRYAQNYYSSLHMDIGQISPERFKLTDHRGRGYRGNLLLTLNFLPEVTGQARILREAFAPTGHPAIAVPGAATNGQQSQTIDVLIVSMDGSDVSMQDCVRVRISLEADSDYWDGHWGGVGGDGGEFRSVAVSSPGVVDEATAVCRWGRRVELDDDADHDASYVSALYGDLLSLPWDSRLPCVAWERGRASVLKFEVTRGPGQLAEWTGFVPTAGLAHRPGVVLERAVKLTGRVGAEPPMSARSMGSGESGEGCGVTLEVTMVLRPLTPANRHNDKHGRKSTNSAGQISHDNTMMEIQNTSTVGRARQATSDGTSVSPFHPDVRRNPPEPGELVVHCVKVRNLSFLRFGKRGVREVDPELSLTVVPDGGTAATCAHVGGGRHPLWHQTRTLTVADATTARVIVRVLNMSGSNEDNTLGEVELSVAGIVAAEKAVAAAAASSTSAVANPQIQKEQYCDQNTAIEWATYKQEKIEQDESRKPWTGAGSRRNEPSNRVSEMTSRDTKACGVQAWFPLYLPSKTGGNRDRELVGEVRLSFRFLSTAFMLQRQLTAGADEGDNGPIGHLRYVLERRPGRMLITVRCCRALQKAMIGDRAPLVEARLRPGEWTCSTRRQAGLDPVFNENMAAELLWIPPECPSPELLLEVKDKALGGGRMAVIRIPVAPFVLHPRMRADVWYPLSIDGRGDTNSGIFCDLVYVPSPGGVQPDDNGMTGGFLGDRAALERSTVFPTINSIRTQSRSGILHVEVISVRGLPTYSKDPQVGVRLRVYDHRGSSLPPFQRTAAIRGARGEARFDKTFLLSLKQDSPPSGDQVGEDTLGDTPVLEVEARCARGKGRSLGTVEIPLFPLWFMSHMTRTWYPMRVADGKGGAGSVFIGLQFLADETIGSNSAAGGAGARNSKGETEKRRFLFIEVRQGRGLRCARALSGQDPAVHVEMLGSGANAKTPSARDGGTDPEWRDGAGMLTLPYDVHSSSTARRGSKHVSEVLRITAVNERGLDGGRSASNAGTIGAEYQVIGQCDWLVPAEDLGGGRPMSAWHTLWTGGNPSGDIYIRCRVGFEGEALDHSPSRGILAIRKDNSQPPVLAIGNYHVEFLDVRGFKQILRRSQLSSDLRTSGAAHGVGVSWEGKAYMAASPAAAGDVDAAHGAPSVPVGSGRAIAVGTRGRGSGGYLCVKMSTTGCVGIRRGSGPVVAVCSVAPRNLQPLTEVPGSELREWLPMVAMHDRGKGIKGGAEDADTGQILISVSYSPLAVGVLEVSVLETEVINNIKRPKSSSPRVPTASGTFKALTRLLPAKTGASMGHRVRSTPARRGFRTMNDENLPQPQCAVGDGIRCSWADTRPNRMRYNNAFNGRPTTLHVTVTQGENILGYATVATEAIVQGVMASMAREIDVGGRKMRRSARDLGPIGLKEEDFGDSSDAWYPLKLPSAYSSRDVLDGNVGVLDEDAASGMNPIEGEDVGRIRVAVRFAPHPKVLLPNWQEGAAVERAKGIMAMKALFYRVDRSGSLVVEKEDLRVAFVEAAEAFVNESTENKISTQRAVDATMTAWSGVGGGGGMAQAGGFVLKIMQVLEGDETVGIDSAIPHTAVDTVFAAIDRNRSGEVSFAEYCAFLLKAAARQAEAEVAGLLDELAEDNDDDCDDDSEDDIYRESHYDGKSVELKLRGAQREEVPSSQNGTVHEVREGRSTGRPRASQLQQSRSNTTAEGNRSIVAVVCNAETSDDPAFSALTTRQRPIASLRQDPASRGQHHSDLQATGRKVRRIPRISSDRHGVTRASVATAHEVAPQPEANEPLKKDFTKWMVGDVIRWLLERLQLDQYEDVFRDASVDGLVLADLTDDLLKEMGVLNPLHRLKILRHSQELHKQQRIRDRKNSGLHLVQSRTRTTDEFSPPRPANEQTPHQASGSREEAIVDTQEDERHKRRERQFTLGAGVASSSDHRIKARRSDLGAGELFGSTGEPWGNVAVDEGAFEHVMKEVRSECLHDTRKSTSTVARGRPHGRNRKVPTNATTAEVLEVVKHAMWKAAATLENQPSEPNIKQNPRKLNHDDFPEIWWESSEGGSVSENRENHRDPALKLDINTMDEPWGGIGVRLLFTEFVKFQPGRARSKHYHTGSASRLTRPKLEGGIRFLLGIDMRWEQCNQVLNSLVNLRSKGHLTIDDFATAFGFQIFALSPEIFWRQSHPSPCREAENSEVSPRTSVRDPTIETAGRMEVNPEEELTNLCECVIGMGDKLGEMQLTLQGVVARFDSHNAGKISVSEFVSLVKVLTTSKRGTANGYSKGGFSRRQAYLLLHSVDRNRDGIVLLRDFVQIVYSVWTEELSRLRTIEGERDRGGDMSVFEVVRQERRQLQKDLRCHFPARFRRKMRLDETSCDTVNGPYSALLKHMGLAKTPTPPTARLHRTFGSPRRMYRGGNEHGDDGFITKNSGEKSRLGAWEDWETGGVRGRALSASPPRRSYNGRFKQSWGGDRSRAATWSGGRTGAVSQMALGSADQVN